MTSVSRCTVYEISHISLAYAGSIRATDKRRAHRQTDRLTDRQTNRDGHTQTYGPTDGHTQTYGPTDGHTQTYGPTDGHTDRRTDR
jgi:hypothetical protein